MKEIMAVFGKAATDCFLRMLAVALIAVPVAGIKSCEWWQLGMIWMCNIPSACGLLAVADHCKEVWRAENGKA